MRNNRYWSNTRPIDCIAEYSIDSIVDLAIRRSRELAAQWGLRPRTFREWAIEHRDAVPL